MAEIIGKAGVEFFGEDSDLVRALRQNQRRMESFGNQGERQTGRFNKGLRGVAVAAGVAAAAIGVAVAAASAVGGAAIKAFAEFEQAETSFTVFLGSAERAKDLLLELEEFGATTTFDFPGLSKAAEQLIQTGTAASQVTDVLESLGNTALGQEERLQTLVSVFGRVSNAGRATAEELNRLAETGGVPLAELAEAAGVDGALGLRELASQGKLTADILLPALLAIGNEGGSRFGFLAIASEKLAGQLSNLRDAAQRALRIVGEQLTENLDLSTVLPQITELIERIIPRLGTILEAVLGGTGDGLQDVIGLVEGAVRIVQGAIGVVFEIGSVASGVLALVIRGLALLATAVVKVFTLFLADTPQWVQDLDALGQGFQENAQRLSNAGSDLLGEALDPAPVRETTEELGNLGDEADDAADSMARLVENAENLSGLRVPGAEAFLDIGSGIGKLQVDLTGLKEEYRAVGSGTERLAASIVAANSRALTSTELLNSGVKFDRVTQEFLELESRLDMALQSAEDFDLSQFTGSVDEFLELLDLRNLVESEELLRSFEDQAAAAAKELEVLDAIRANPEINPALVRQLVEAGQAIDGTKREVRELDEALDALQARQDFDAGFADAVERARELGEEFELSENAVQGIIDKLTALRDGGADLTAIEGVLADEESVASQLQVFDELAAKLEQAAAAEDQFTREARRIADGAGLTESAIVGIADELRKINEVQQDTSTLQSMRDELIQLEAQIGNTAVSAARLAAQGIIDPAQREEALRLADAIEGANQALSDEKLATELTERFRPIQDVVTEQVQDLQRLLRAGQIDRGTFNSAIDELRGTADVRQTTTLTGLEQLASSLVGIGGQTDEQAAREAAIDSALSLKKTEEYLQEQTELQREAIDLTKARITSSLAGSPVAVVGKPSNRTAKR